MKDVDNAITDLGTDLNLYKFEPINNVGTAIETVTRDTILTYNQVITATGRGINADAIKAFEFLAKAETFAVVHYNSGESRLFGADYFLISSGGENTSGEASGDNNTFSVELTGIEVDAAPTLLSSTKGDPFAGLTNQPIIN